MCLRGPDRDGRSCVSHGVLPRAKPTLREVARWMARAVHARSNVTMLRCLHVMTRNLVMCSPRDTAGRAGQLMRSANVGFLPVINDDEELIGCLTDRDLATRVVAEG